MTEFYWPIIGSPNIKRDTTNFNSDGWLEANWMRFYNELPKKIGGYQLTSQGNEEIIRDCYSVDRDNAIDLYVGRSGSLQVIRITSAGIASAPRDRTPTVTYVQTEPGVFEQRPWVANPLFTWCFADVSCVSGITGDNQLRNYIIAVPIPNLDDINNTDDGVVYFGSIDDNEPLQPMMLVSGATPALVPITTSGGVTVLGSNIFVYDKNGLIFWNNGYQITATDTTQTWLWNTGMATTIGTYNFVYGAPVRNGNTLGGLFWAVKGVAKASFIQFNAYSDEGPEYQQQSQYDISYLSSTSTLLSSSSIVFYDPYFYWPGEGTFYFYNGIVSELENDINRLYFFKNIQDNNKNHVFGFANQAYQEIWWGWPNGLSVAENNWALIHNKKYSSWFDTPNFTRSCGISASTLLPYPVMCSSTIETIGIDTSYPIWIHEIGLDKVVITQTTAIPCSIQSRFIDNQNYQSYTIDTFIIDMKSQPTDMLFQISAQGYPQTTPVISPAITIASGQDFQTMKIKGNLLSAIFTVNEQGGDLYLGNNLLKVIINQGERPSPTDE